MRALLLIGAAVLTLSSSGCIDVYRMDVQQGNVVAQEMIDKVKPGMTRAQVRFVLGTPLINDPFHPDRWDYVYFQKKFGGDSAPEMHRLTAIFEGDTLARLEGDVVGQASSPDATEREPERDETPAPLPQPLSRKN